MDEIKYSDTIELKKHAGKWKFNDDTFSDFTGKILTSDGYVTMMFGFLHSFNDEPSYHDYETPHMIWHVDGKIKRAYNQPPVIMKGENLWLIGDDEKDSNFHTLHDFLRITTTLTEEQKLELILRYDK